MYNFDFLDEFNNLILDNIPTRDLHLSDRNFTDRLNHTPRPSLFGKKNKDHSNKIPLSDFDLLHKLKRNISKLDSLLDDLDKTRSKDSTKRLSTKRDTLLAPKDQFMPIPLKNTGSDCYMKSVFQALLPTFSNLITSQIKNRLIKEKPAWSLLNTFNKRFVKRSSFSILNHIKKNSDIKYFGSDFRWNYQEDAHEFLVSFLDKLETEFKTLDKEENIANKVRSLFGLTYDCRPYCDKCNKTNNPEPVLMKDLGLILPIGGTFENMLSNALVQKIEGYSCESCKTTSNSAETQSILLNSPEYLITCIKRFSVNSSYETHKLDDPVEVKDTIEIPVMIDEDVFLERYDLVSIVCHVGRLGFGHYFTFVKNNENWYKANDENIEKTDFAEVEKDIVGKNYIHIYKNMLKKTIKIYKWIIFKMIFVQEMIL